jgi:type VII secretion integral membrane protein EccD
MTGSYYTITVVGARRRLDLRLPADVPVGELTGELVALLDEPVDDPPARWGLVRLGGVILDAERGLAAQDVPAGAMLFVRDLGTVEPPTEVDDHARAVAAEVEASPGRWTPAWLQALLVLVAAAWVLAAGVLAGRGLPAGAAADPAGPLATSVAVAAVLIGRPLRSPRTGAVLALSALPLWAIAGFGLTVQMGLGGPAPFAGAMVGLAIGGVAVGAAADAGLGPAVGLAAASVPWALTLAACAWLDAGIALGAAVVAPLALAALRLAPWLVVRTVRLDGEPVTGGLTGRAAAGRQLLGALTAGTALTLGGACVVLAAQTSGWARALAVTAALAALLHARRRRFVTEVAPLWLVPLATLATFELQAPLDPTVRLALLAGTGVALAALGVAGRAVRLPVGLRRQLERAEALSVVATGPLALGLLGLYDLAARFAGRFG